MLKAGCDSDLAEEPVGTDRGGELGSEHLYGDRPIVPVVLCQVYRGHAALADQALDCIAPFERGTQLLERIVHQGASAAGMLGKVKHRCAVCCGPECQAVKARHTQ